MAFPNSNSSSVWNDDSEVCKATRAIIEGSKDYAVGRVDPFANSQDIAHCIDLLGRRIIAGSDRSCQYGADAVGIWTSILDDCPIQLEQTPLCLIRYILAFAMNELVNLPDDPGSRPSSSSGTGSVDDGGPTRELLAEPILMDGDEIRAETLTIVTEARPYSAVRPIHQSVTAQEITECIFQTLPRVIAEVPEDEFRDEETEIWQDILNTGTDVLGQQAPQILAAVLAIAWRDLIDNRGVSHEHGKCSCENNAADDATPSCRAE